MRNIAHRIRLLEAKEQRFTLQTGTVAKQNLKRVQRRLGRLLRSEMVISSPKQSFAADLPEYLPEPYRRLTRGVK